MGYSKDLFLAADTLDEEFICTICHDVMEDPVMSDVCEHIFCKSCITTWQEDSVTCPLDRGEILGTLRPPYRSYLNMLNRLACTCKYVANGCSQELNLGGLEKHIEACHHNPDRIIRCSRNCGAVTKASNAHDCVTFLKKKLDEKEYEVSQLRNDVKIQLRLKNMEIKSLEKKVAKLEESFGAREKAYLSNNRQSKNGGGGGKRKRSSVTCMVPNYTEDTESPASSPDSSD